MTVFIISNTIIFICLSAFHFYWAFGGKTFSASTVPTNKKGQKVLKPGMISSLVVAIGLIVFALITFGNAGIFNNLIPQRFTHYAAYVISIIFFLRAVGDFKYVGFFKKINRTAFAKNDTRIYSPLCLIISISSFIIAFSN